MTAFRSHLTARRLHQTRVATLLVMAVLVGGPSARSQVGDPELDAGRQLAPLHIRLDENPELTPLPPWMAQGVVIDESLDSVIIPLPALRNRPAERLALTVVFDDGGDGGPAVEWRHTDGSSTYLSDGLGEALDDRPLGLNARTVLLPQELAHTGGTLVVSYFDRFSALASLSVQPAREGRVAVVGARNDPALVDHSLRVLPERATNGRRLEPIFGDVRYGTVVEAELAAAIEPLDEGLEFLVPIDGSPEAVMLRTEVLGLDPEATLEVWLNDTRVGTLAMAAFALDDPTVARDARNRMVVAGWRDGSLFIPARLWGSGENVLQIRLTRSAYETGREVFLRHTVLHLRFRPDTNPSVPLISTPSEPSPPPSTHLLIQQTDPPLPESGADEREIDFLEPQAFIAPPPTEFLPRIITTPP